MSDISRPVHLYVVLLTPAVVHGVCLSVCPHCKEKRLELSTLNSRQRYMCAVCGGPLACKTLRLKSQRSRIGPRCVDTTA